MVRRCLSFDERSESRTGTDILKTILRACCIAYRVTLAPPSHRFEGVQRVTRARHSIPHFISADPEALSECLPPCTDSANPVKYEPVTQDPFRKMGTKL